jgi:16S rRNA (cytosine1402-N4)-methyltransferase
MHKTVLLQESIDALNLKKGAVFVDGTFGGGGHSAEACERFGKDVSIFAFDLDSDAIEAGKAKFADAACDIKFFQDNFKNLDKVLHDEGRAADGILVDLGYSSDQLESSNRGLSFLRDEPLKMTLKKTISETEFDASDIVNTWDEEDIANVIYAYGEEQFARRIARDIVAARENSPIKTTTDLVAIITNAVPAFYKRGKIHPATKTFQALRIAVNDELGNLKAVLEKGFESLASEGRMAVISFHSLEDRIVKNFFRDKDKEGSGELITKKPIIPSQREIKENPRSRSAKLRVIKKL